MFAGLSAFPLTPMRGGRADLDQLASLVGTVAEAGVDSIGVLGSTGSYAYLTVDERADIARAAVDGARGLPVVIGVGAISTRDVLLNVEQAMIAGAAGVLLAPLTYQPLTDDEVFALYESVDDRFRTPIVVYDNPRTTGFTFSDELHARIAQLPHVASIKFPPLGGDVAAARARLQELRRIVPERVTIGVSGDAAAARGLSAGADVWYSVLAGILPHHCLQITRAATGDDEEGAATLSSELDAVWTLFDRYGSYRVASALAVELGLLAADSTHLPVQALDGAARDEVRAAARRIRTF